MNKTDKDLLYEVAKLSQFSANEAIFWRYNDERTQIDVYANCSDIFFWGCADAEPITWDNLQVLRDSVREVQELTGSEFSNQDDGLLLFVARVRNERPQGAFYKYITVHNDDEKTASLRALFDAAGPERETGFGNPVDRKEFS